MVRNDGQELLREQGRQNTWDTRSFYPCNAWGSLSEAQQQDEDEVCEEDNFT